MTMVLQDRLDRPDHQENRVVVDHAVLKVVLELQDLLGRKELPANPVHKDLLDQSDPRARRARKDRSDRRERKENLDHRVLQANEGSQVWKDRRELLVHQDSRAIRASRDLWDRKAM